MVDSGELGRGGDSGVELFAELRESSSRPGRRVASAGVDVVEFVREVNNAIAAITGIELLAGVELLAELRGDDRAWPGRRARDHFGAGHSR